MIERGSSVLNSAMASWVFSVFAPLADRWGDGDTASEARALSGDLRRRVAEAWNGRWFHRAYAPDGSPVGDEDCWLEVQPWAILCGAADDEPARQLLGAIRSLHQKGSPLGARVRWSPEGTPGSVWFSINMTLIWAAARLDPDLAWDEWRRMTLTTHTATHPDLWTGTLSGPDDYDPPESDRPGSTWMPYPVGCLHSHAQPVLSYLRLLGVEPTPRGTLALGRGARYESKTLRLEEDGSGALTTIGPVHVEAASGPRTGSGTVEF